LNRCNARTQAIVFDLDGVLVESEGVWNSARRDIALRNGGRWPPEAQRAMMGMSSSEWSTYMHDDLGIAMAPAEISDASEEMAHGKPAPDVYLEAARQVGVPAPRCAAVEDSSNGLRSAAAAGTTVFAVPNREFPPSADALALAADVLDSIAELTPARVRRVGGGRWRVGGDRASSS
jgi:beta-phosphoglucomutase-like phosphatase (HAD superfamily)